MTLGIFSAILAFLWWGLSPIYWKLLQNFPPSALLVHRIIWSTLFIAILISIQKRWPEIKIVFSSACSLITFLATASLIGANWLIFIMAVNEGHLIEASLGYFICPLMNVLLGVIVLRERLNIIQLSAILLAAAGVVNATIDLGTFPWIALSLATTFSLYALLRKTATVESLPGLAIETFVLILPAFAYLLFFSTSESSLNNISLVSLLVLVGTGAISTLPLIFYTFSARRITLSTIGLLQYIAPTCMFLLGVFIYQEPFTNTDLLTFGLIWTGLFVYLGNSLRSNLRVKMK